MVQQVLGYAATLVTFVVVWWAASALGQWFKRAKDRDFAAKMRGIGGVQGNWVNLMRSPQAGDFLVASYGIGDHSHSHGDAGGGGGGH